MNVEHADISIDTTESDQGTGRQSGMSPQPHLFVVLHCDDLTAGGARYSLSDVDVVTLGRGEARSAMRERKGALHALDLRLPGTTLSSFHARILRQGEGFLLEDTLSKNGTFRNGERIKSALLRDGDLIAIGRVILRYRAAVPTPPEEPVDLDSASVTTPADGFATLLPELAERHASLARIAKKSITVLLLGETGTGKEVTARAVHTLSASARKGPFVAVNCGGLPPTLLESQLFGYVKGSFTGAHRDEPGTIRSAHGGTLFLDEIGDLPLHAQAALLRVLQEREVVPVGGTRPVKIDLRVMAATHKRLQEMVLRGEFRGDLLARVSGYPHRLDPLRDRIEDIGVLIAEILRRAQADVPASIRLSSASALRLLHYHWPFNIRELAQWLSMAAAIAPEGVIEPSDWPEGTLEAPLSGEPGAAPRDPEALRRDVVALLVKHKGEVTAVARDLGKRRTQVHRWMQRFGIDPDDYRG